MKWNSFVKICCLVSLVYVISCDEIIVPDISGNSLTLNDPADSLMTEARSQRFSWDSIVGVTSYRITITSSAGLIVDSLLRQGSFSTVLDTGEYYWCVQATNSAYASSKACRTLFIMPEAPKTDDISDINVTLLAPADTLKTKTKQQLFWWNKVDGASRYNLVIVSPDMLAPVTIALDTVIVNNSITHQLAVGKYQWCVRALNAAHETTYICRKLEITE
jgi:hypothetical protein